MWETDFHLPFFTSVNNASRNCVTAVSIGVLSFGNLRIIHDENIHRPEVKRSEVNCREGGKNETLWENLYE